MPSQDAVDNYKGGTQLSFYNDIYCYLVVNCFMKLTDFGNITDPANWLPPEEGNIACPFDAVFEDIDLLSDRMLQYWDFLVANAPFFNLWHGDAITSVEYLPPPSSLLQ